MTTIDLPRIGPGVDPLPPGTASQVVPADRIRGDATRYAQEVDLLFRRSWFVACHAGEIPPGDGYTTWSGFGEPVVIVRRGERIAAFSNVCQHRGAKLLRGTGPIDGHIRCPWHGWQYRSDDGALVAVRERSSFAPDHIEGVCLDELAVAEYGGFVWVNFDREGAPPLEAYLGRMHGELERAGLSSMTYHGNHVFDFAVSWKEALAAFLEVYHVADSHGTTIGKSLQTVQTTYHFEGPHSFMCIPYGRTDLAALRQPVDHFAVADVHMSVFPFTTLDFVGGHAYIGSFIPTGPATTRFTFWLVYDAARSAASRQGRYLDLFAEIVGEDAVLLRDLAETRTSQAYAQQRYSARECRISHLLDTVDRIVSR